jgi:hypothetical protein
MNIHQTKRPIGQRKHTDMEAPIIAEMRTKKEIGKIIREITSQHGLSIEFDDANLHVHPKFIAEYTGSKKPISSAIFDFMFPHEDCPATLDHFTSLDALKNIAAENTFRLYSIMKRVDEGELKHFANDHSLDGYLDGTDGPPLYKEFAEDLFYTAFTQTGSKNQAHMWGAFGNQEKGVRLRFKIVATGAELRSINYQDSSRHLLRTLNEKLSESSYPPFNPWTISKIGAFYLPATLTFEDEVRLLVKRYDSTTSQAKSDGSNEYWPIPLGIVTNFGAIHLLSITYGAKLVEQDVRSVLCGTPYESIPLQPA